MFNVRLVDVGSMVFVTPHVHFRRYFVTAVFVTVKSRQVTETVACAV